MPSWIKLVRRADVTRTTVIAVTAASFIFAFLLASIIFFWQGINPVAAYHDIFISAFGSLRGLYFTTLKAIPLLLCAVGLILVFKANVWNIGAEGQLLLGAVAAGWVALYALPNAPSFVVIPVMFILGAVAGAAWAAIPGFLKGKFNVNEIIVTLMMNYIAYKIVEYLIYGPWRGAGSWGYPITDEFPETAQLPLIPGTPIHYPTLVLAILSSLAMYFLLSRTKFGFEVKAVGYNVEAARYAGISFFKVCFVTMLISGALAGIAGVGEVAGLHHRLIYPWSISSGYGFSAIIVAWLARLHPIAAIFMSFLLGGLFVGGYAIQVSMGLSYSVIHLFNGLILICLIASEILLNYQIVLPRGELKWQRLKS